MIDNKNVNTNKNQGEVVIYQTDNGATKIDVRFVDETVSMRLYGLHNNKWRSCLNRQEAI